MTEEFDIPQESDAQNVNNADLPPLSVDSSDDDLQKPGMSKKQKIILISVAAAVLIGLIGLIIGLILFSGRDNEDDRILDNVYAAGIELSGMTVEEAIAALHDATDQSFSKEPMVIHIYEDTLSLYPEDTNASVDVEAIAQAAYLYGRSANHAENQQIRNNAHKRSYTIPLLPYLNLDYTAIRNIIENYCADIESDYAEPVVTIEGNRPADPEQAHDDQVMKITLGTPLCHLDAEDLYNQVLDTYSMNELLLEYDAPDILYPTELDAQALFDQYCVPAQDAKLDLATYSITKETWGYGFDVNDLKQKLNNARPGEELEPIVLFFIEPEVLSQDISDSLYSVTLTEYQSTSDVKHSGRDNNLLLSCNAINGIVIKPGETFSFAQSLGKVSKQTGYSEAPICSINETVMGGGISQTASALYYCALHADLDVVKRQNHPYATDFIELGMDAYVDGNGIDLCFRNNTDSPIRINAAVTNQTVSISLESSKELSFTVAIRSEVTGTETPGTIYQMFMPDNHQGYKEGDVIVTGVEGYQVSVQKEKTDNATGNLSQESISTNEYKKRDTIIARIGTLADDETPPEPSDETVPLE